MTIPTAWPVVNRLAVSSVTFNRSDKQSEFGEVDQSYIRELEEALLRGADRVMYVSHALMAAEEPLTGDRARFLDHGVDLQLFRPDLPVHEDLADVARPRIGFFGGFDDYVIDMDLLERLAKSLPEAQLVLIGDATCSMERLTSQPNVHWLGYRPYEEIPRFGSGFDVAIMPWLRNGWIEACNPIKLKEYLALGLPIVSTDFPEVHYYEDLVRIAGDADEFIEHGPPVPGWTTARALPRAGARTSPRRPGTAAPPTCWRSATRRAPPTGAADVRSRRDPPLRRAGRRPEAAAGDGRPAGPSRP